MKKILVAIIASAVIIASAFSLFACNNVDTGNPAPTGYDFKAHETLYNQIIASESEYLKGLQLDCGAICKWSNGAAKQVVCPYFSCFAGLALLEVGGAENVAAVKKYCDWHFTNLNKTPDYNNLTYTIYDFNVTEVGGETVLVPTVSYDSVDSYAALFLMLLESYEEVSGDRAYITAHSSEIAGVYNAMLSSKSASSGLTNAKPDYKIQYLMDNSEVYAGIEAAEDLFEILGDTAKKDAADTAAEGIKIGIMNLFDETNGVFAPNASALSADKEVFYPDMAAQLYPVVFDVIEKESAEGKAVYASFKENFGSVDKLYADGGADFPWLMVAYAAYCYEDYGFATALLENANTQYISTGNSGKWYCMEGAMACLTACKMAEEIK